MIFKKWPKAACDRSIHPKNFDFAFHVLFSYAPRGYLFYANTSSFLSGRV